MESGLGRAERPSRPFCAWGISVGWGSEAVLAGIWMGPLSAPYSQDLALLWVVGYVDAAVRLSAGRLSACPYGLHGCW